MKKVYVSFVVAMVICLTPGVFSKPRVTISVDVFEQVSRMERQIRRLERRVSQLEAQISTGGTIVQDIGVVETIIQDTHTCFIETPFNGTFSVTAASEGQATGEVMKECSQKAKGKMHCELSDVTCKK